MASNGIKWQKGEYIYLNIRYKIKHEKEKQKKCTKNIRETFVSFKKVPTFASAIEKQTQIRESKKQKCYNRMARSSIG